MESLWLVYVLLMCVAEKAFIFSVKPKSAGYISNDCSHPE